MSKINIFDDISIDFNNLSFEDKLTYDELYNVIFEAANQIKPKKNDEKKETQTNGRIESALKEKDYIKLLEENIKKINNTIKIEVPKDRFWYDIKINDIPINIKITAGGTDNAFNKIAVIYTLTGKIPKKNMNFNEFYKYLDVKSIKENSQKRNKFTEYHYLVFSKKEETILFKSILDIHTFKDNPCNILQINWKNEFEHITYFTEDEKAKEKIKELLKVIQLSKIKEYNSAVKFINANFDEVF